MNPYPKMALLRVFDFNLMAKPIKEMRVAAPPNVKSARKKLCWIIL